MTINLNMTKSTTGDLALLVLRIIIISIFLYHGFPKAVNWAMAMEKFTGFGLPGFLGPITGIAEVIASGFLIVGFQNRWTNYVLMFIIAGAIATVQLPEALKAGEYTAGLERDLLILGACWISALFGAGAFSLDTKREMSSTRDQTRLG